MDNMNKYDARNIPNKLISSRMLVKLTKLKESDNPKHPGNIPEGHIVEEWVSKGFFMKPTIGERFWVGIRWSTSPVKEIIDDNTFRTYNSIYEWEIT